MKVLNIGSLNVDHVYTVDHMTSEGETQNSFKLDVFAGGKGLNQSISLKKSGVCVYHAGLIGKGGEMLLDVCNENDLSTKYLQNCDVQAGHAIIQVDKSGKNCILLYGGSNKALTTDYIDSVLNDFSKDDILLLQNEVNLMGYIVDKAFEKGITIILNPSPFNAEIKKIDFSKISYFIMNEIEGDQISGFKDPLDILAYMKKIYKNAKTVLTLGSKGSYYSDENETIFQEIFKVKAVDTTAAGDTFTGYFIYGLINNLSKSECLKIAAKASSITVTKEGAVSSIPKLNEVLA